MARRYKFGHRKTRPLLFTGIIVAVAALTLLLYAILPSGKNEQTAQAAPKTVVLPPAKDKGIELSSVRIEKPADKTEAVSEKPATQPIRIVTPTTQPNAMPAIVAPTINNSNPKTAPTVQQSAPQQPATIQKTQSNPSNTSPNTLIAQADEKRKTEDLLGARKLLVDAIDSKKLTDTEQDDALRRLSEINETIVFSPRKFLDDPNAVAHVVKPGELMQKIAQQYDVTWKWIGRLNNISDPRKLQANKTLKIVKGPFHALVNKTHFTLDIYIGKPTEPGAIFVKRFLVGLGENDSTPTGVWNVDNKLENPRYYNPRADGPRVIEPDDPKNPLGERWIALVGASGQAVGKTSYGIHGTIEPTSIGQRKSMGCVRMLNEDVELVYDMLISGKSTVTVIEDDKK